MTFKGKENPGFFAKRIRDCDIRCYAGGTLTQIEVLD